MGTPEFAVPSFHILVRNNFPIIGVITQPDRPRGRGQTLAPPPVKTVAEQHHLTVVQPDKLKNPEFLGFFRNLAPDLVVVAAFGQILPGEMIHYPPMGCINVHPSLLPKYRGAAPIHWPIIQGKTKTGVTIMRMDEGMDTGDIISQEKTTIEADETFGMLHDRLAKMGAELLLSTIEMMRHGSTRAIPQDDSLATYAPRLKKDDGLIQWNSDVHRTVNLIRGLSPKPGAYTFFEKKKLKILFAEGERAPVEGNTGEVGKETERGLPVAAQNGYVYLKDIQLEGRKRMSVHDFLKGCRMLPGTQLGSTP